MSETALTTREGARAVVAALENAGVSLVATLPDSWIGPLVEEMRRSPVLRVVDVAREEEAVALACGARLAGTRAAVAIQNAGVLNCGTAIASIAQLYRIPCFMLVSFRGDERDPVFFHVQKARVTEPTLDAWGVRHARAAGPARIRAQIEGAIRWTEEARAPFALLFSLEDLQ